MIPTKRIAGICVLLFFMILSVTMVLSKNAHVEQLYGKGAQIVPGTILVKFSSNTGNVESNGEIAQLMLSHGVLKHEPLFKSVRYQSTLKRTVTDLSKIYKLSVPQNTNILNLCFELQSHPNVVYAEPDFYEYAQAIPNDSLYFQQTHLPQIFMPETWDIAKGNKNVVLAIVGTGVDWDHPDLAAAIWSNEDEVIDGIDNDNNGFIDDIRGWDFVDNASSPAPGEDGDEQDNDPMDFDGHETHVAGLAAAITNNVTGVAGVSWGCSIMPLRGGYQNADGDGVSSGSGLANAFLYAADNGADFINYSWSSYGQTIVEAARYAFELGALVINSAGNGDNRPDVDPTFPGSLGIQPFVLTVGAVDDRDLKSSYSSYGPWVTVAAPGGDTNRGRPGLLSTFFDDSYASFQGTSMAAPVVTGLAGLMKSYNSEWTNADILFRITETTDFIYDKNPDYMGQMGTGRINALRALTDEINPKPTIEFIRFSVQDSLTGNNNKIIDIGETVDIIVEFRNLWAKANNLTATLEFDDPEITVLNNTSNFGEFLGLEDISSNVRTNEFAPFTISVNPNSVPRRLLGKIKADIDGEIKVYDIDFAITPRILVIDDDAPGKDGFNKDVENFYYEALDAIDVSFDTWDIDFLQEEPHSKRLAPYDIIIWGTEVTNPTLNTNNRAALQNYFDKSGGNAIIFGQDIAWDLADVTSDTNEYNRNSRSKDWFEKYLGASFISDDGQYNRVNGVVGSPITEGISFNFEQPMRPLNLQNPDVIDTLNGSEAILTTPGGDIAAVTQSGRSNQGFEWSSIYYAFGGLEAIGDKFIRQDLLAKSINYLNGVHVFHAPLKDVTVPTEREILVNISLVDETLELEKIELHYTVDGAFPATIVPMESETADLFKATIPQVEGGVIDYQILVKTTMGYYAPRIHYSYSVGADLKPPKITLVKPLINAIDKVGPLEVISQVDDNFGVDENAVFVHYWTNHTVVDSINAVKMENSLNYKARITGDFMYGDTLMYYTSATDIAAVPNLGTTGIDTVVLGLEDFESGLVAWEADSAGQWGIVAEDPFDGFFNLDDSPGATPLPDNETILKLKASLNLSSSNYAVITYAARNMLRPAKDLGYLELSADNGETWKEVAKFTSLKPAWKEYFVPIGEFTGPGFENVLLRIRLKTKTGDITEKFTGMEIDNLFIREDIAQHVSEESETLALPVDFSLAQNFPNPFNPTTTIEYNVPKQSLVKIEIYNMLGQRIRTLIDQNRPAGNYSIMWNAKDDSGANVASGMYFYRMNAGDFSALRKLVLLK